MKRKVPPLALLLTVALLALIETAQALLGPGREASEADWKAAAAEVRAGFHPGDLIVFAPYWADQTGRMHLGDLVTVEMAGRADADRYGRIWEVAIRGARAPETRDLVPVRRGQHGRVTVALYQKPAVQIAYDFTTAFSQARVSPGTRAEPRTLEIDYQPRRGLLTPVERGRTTTIEYPDVPLGRTLVGYTGLHDYYSRKRADGPVDFKVFIDGEEKLAVRHGNDDGWRRFSVETKPGLHTVRFEVSAKDPAFRTFGFHAEARR